MKAIKEDSYLRNTPIILLSARAGDSDKAEGMVGWFLYSRPLVSRLPQLSGADGDAYPTIPSSNYSCILDYLSKPFSSKELLARANFQMQLGKRKRDMEARFQYVPLIYLRIGLMIAFIEREAKRFKYSPTYLRRVCSE